jgi:hypothetical protein
MGRYQGKGIRGALVAALAVLLLAGAGPARAFDVRSGDTVVIAADQVVTDDVYVAANEFRLEGTIQGDLVVAARLVTINGLVEGDVIAAGQVVRVNGAIADDARLVGAALILGEGAQVADDLLSLAYSLETIAGSAAGGTLAFVGSQALLAGAVAEEAMLAGSAVELRGEVQGSAHVNVSGSGNRPPFSPFVFMPGVPALPAVRPGLTVDPAARVGGDLVVSGDEGAIAAGTVAGQVIRDPAAQAPAEQTPPASPGARLLNWLAGAARRLIVLLLVGLLVLWLAPNLARGAAAALRERPLPSAGWGLLALIGVPLAVLLVGAGALILALLLNLVTLGALAGVVAAAGVWLAGALVLALVVGVGYLAHVVVSYVLGRWMLGRINSPAADSRLWPLLLGVIVVVALTALPFVGWVFSLAIVVLGLGALILVLVRRREAVQQPAAVVMGR